MSTEVFVNVNGMVQHRHPGAKGWGKKGWHDPSKKHPELHESEGAALPTNLALLTPDQVGQYENALAGNSWMTSNLARSTVRRVEAGIEICGGENHGSGHAPVPATKAEAPVVVAPIAPVKERRTAPREFVTA